MIRAIALAAAVLVPTFAQAKAQDWSKECRTVMAQAYEQDLARTIPADRAREFAQGFISGGKGSSLLAVIVSGNLEPGQWVHAFDMAFMVGEADAACAQNAAAITATRKEFHEGIPTIITMMTILRTMGKGDLGKTLGELAKTNP